MSAENELDGESKEKGSERQPVEGSLDSTETVQDTPVVEEDHVERLTEMAQKLVESGIVQSVEASSDGVEEDSNPTPVQDTPGVKFEIKEVSLEELMGDNSSGGEIPSNEADNPLRISHAAEIPWSVEKEITPDRGIDRTPAPASLDVPTMPKVGEQRGDTVKIKGIGPTDEEGKAPINKDADWGDKTLIYEEGEGFVAVDSEEVGEVLDENGNVMRQVRLDNLNTAASFDDMEKLIAAQILEEEKQLDGTRLEMAVKLLNSENQKTSIVDNASGFKTKDGDEKRDRKGNEGKILLQDYEGKLRILGVTVENLVVKGNVREKDLDFEPPAVEIKATSIFYKEKKEDIRKNPWKYCAVKKPEKPEKPAEKKLGKNSTDRERKEEKTKFEKRKKRHKQKCKKYAIDVLEHRKSLEIFLEEIQKLEEEGSYEEWLENLTYKEIVLELEKDYTGTKFNNLRKKAEAYFGSVKDTISGILAGTIRNKDGTVKQKISLDGIVDKEDIVMELDVTEFVHTLDVIKREIEKEENITRKKVRDAETEALYQLMLRKFVYPAYGKQFEPEKAGLIPMGSVVVKVNLEQLQKASNEFKLREEATGMITRDNPHMIDPIICKGLTIGNRRYQISVFEEGLDYSDWEDKKLLEEILTPLLKALEFNEKRGGVKHRDINLKNIIVTKEGAKLADLGIAKVETGGKGNVTIIYGSKSGTPDHMSVEQIVGVDLSTTDIALLGKTFLEIWTGKELFPGIDNIMQGVSLGRKLFDPMKAEERMYRGLDWNKGWSLEAHKKNREINKRRVEKENLWIKIQGILAHMVEDPWVKGKVGLKEGIFRRGHHAPEQAHRWRYSSPTEVREDVESVLNGGEAEHLKVYLETIGVSYEDYIKEVFETGDNQYITETRKALDKLRKEKDRAIAYARVGWVVGAAVEKGITIYEKREEEKERLAEEEQERLEKEKAEERIKRSGDSTLITDKDKGEIDAIVYAQAEKNGNGNK